MAGNLLAACTAEIALTAATAKTVIQATAPSNIRVKITGWGVAFDAVDPNAEPVQVAIYRQTTAGTMTSLSPVSTNACSETVQTTASHTATAEPTNSNLLDAFEVHPQSGYEKLYPLGSEIIIPGGGRVGIVCTAPAGVNVRAKFFMEE